MPLISLAAMPALGGEVYFYIKGSRYQSTDYVCAQAATVSISANVGGLQLTHVDTGFLLQAGLSANVTVDTLSIDRELAVATGPASAQEMSC